VYLKLPSSGEKFEDAIKPEIIKDYYEHSSLVYFKWVVSNEDDYEDVLKAIDAYSTVLGPVMNEIPIYLMSAGGTIDGYEPNHRWVAEMAMKNGWRYTPRLQVELWRNAWAT